MTDPKEPHKGVDPSDDDKVQVEADETPAKTAVAGKQAETEGGAHDHDHDHAHDHDEEHGESKSILIDVEELTAEGKANAEKELRRSIPDHAYQVTSQETKPGSVVELAIEMGGDIYKAEQNLLLNDLRKEIVLPGFRKGKAPVNLILKRVGKDAERDTVRSLATNALRQEMEKQKFDLLSKPRILEYTLPEGGEGAMTAVIELETQPVVELKKYKGLEVEVEEQPVTDEMVEQRLEDMRRQNATQETAPADYGLQAQDLVTVDIVATSEAGEELKHLSRKDEAVYDYQNRLPKEIADQLTGKKTGESVTATIRNKSQNRRGEEIVHEDTMTVTIKEIKTTKLPEMDDEFAKDLGDYEGLADLRTKLREELEKGEEERRRAAGLGKLYKELAAENPIDVPKSLVAQQQYRLIMEDNYQMQRYGLRLDQVVQDVDKYMVDQKTSASEIVRLQMLMAKLAEAENLEASDKDVDAEIARMAEESGRKPLAVRARMEAQNQLEEFRKGLGKKKIGEFLLANNTVKYVAAKPVVETAEGEAGEEKAGDGEKKTKAKAKPKAKKAAAEAEGKTEENAEPKAKGKSKKAKEEE